MCLAQGNNAVTPVRFDPAAPRSRVKHSITELPTLSINPDLDLCSHSNSQIWIAFLVAKLQIWNSSLLLISVVAQWLAHLPLVLEVPGSIPARGEENFRVRTCFL